MPDPRLRRPWPLLPHRVERFYSGGALLDAFRAGELGTADTSADPAAAAGDPERAGTPVDGDRPEDWIGSATRAWTPPGTPGTTVGLSHALLDGREVSIADLLEADPEAVAGPALVEATGGPTLGLLVKLLDAAIRLPVHLHPDRAFARRHLSSFFGKSEAWIVLATRQLPGEPAPHVRLGFRREIGSEELRRWIDDEATEPMLDALHRRPIVPGDVWFVPAGQPHAIGAGVFLLELQEPTDFSLVTETRGVPIDRSDASLRLGWDVAIEAVDGRGVDDAGLEALRGPARPPRPESGATVSPLLPSVAGPVFRADDVRLGAGASFTAFHEPSYLVGVVMGGTGQARIGAAGEPLELRPGGTFAVPAVALPELQLTAGVDGLDLIACRPPHPDDLAAGG